jgi:hypothetical protein
MVQDQIRCNVLSVVYGFRVLLNKMIARDKKCGVLIISGGLSDRPIPG